MSRQRDLPAVERLLRQCEAGEPEVYVEFRVRRSNGDSDGVVWLACKGRNAPQAKWQVALRWRHYRHH